MAHKKSHHDGKSKMAHTPKIASHAHGPEAKKEPIAHKSKKK